MRYLLVLFMVAFLLLAACSPDSSTPTTGTNEQAEAVLDQYYEAVGHADFDAFIALFSKEAIFYGTDATEIWTYEEFAPQIRDSFAKGVGWDFTLKDRRLTLSKQGDVAWFSELAHFHNTDYLLRPTGVLALQDGKWKIVQLVMGIPIPNLLYPPVLQGMQATDLGHEPEIDKISTMLNNLHKMAAIADGTAYFNLFTPDAIYMGTDVSERWSVSEFKDYAMPYFSQGKGWKYTPRERHIVLSPMSNVAWFDEVLDSENYGTSRGTGVLIRTPEGWKISQYQLTFPIPNDLAKTMTTQIQQYEKSQTQ